MNNNSEVDVNVLVGLYNQKIASLTNQNILLEAKLQTLTKNYEEEKGLLLMKIAELGTTNRKSKSKSEDNQQSEFQ